MKTTTKEKDFHIVQKALGGDQQAFSLIFNRYRDTLTYQIGKIVVDKDSVEDLVMETFEKAFLKLHRYQPDYCLSTWLLRIGTNCALDYVRHINRTTFVSIEESADNEERATIQVIDEERNPEESVTFKQRMEFLNQYIHTLPYWQQKIIRLRYIEEFSYEEIADECNTNVREIKNLIHTSKRALARLVEATASKEIDKY